MTLRNAFGNVSTEAKQDTQIDRLDDILAELQSTLDVSDTLALAKLEEIRALVNSLNLETTQQNVEALLTEIRDDLVSLVDLVSTGSISAAGGTVVRTITGQAGTAVQLTGTWIGTVTIEGTVNGTDWSPLFFSVTGVGVPMTSYTHNGLMRVNCSGLVAVRVRASTWVSGTVDVSMRASDDAASFLIAGPLPNTTPYRHAKVTLEPKVEFYDPFDGSTIDTTVRWNNTTGTMPPVQGSSALTFGLATTGDAFGAISSRPLFNAQIPGFGQPSFLMQLEAVPVTGRHRFWGVGTAPGVPTTTTPLTDAIGFELATDGKLYAVIYKTGIRVVAIDLSDTGSGSARNRQPLNGGWHRYIVQIRTDFVFWYIDTPDHPVASIGATDAGYAIPDSQRLPIRMSAVNAPGGASAIGTMVCQGAVYADTAGNGMHIKDGVHGHRKASVSSAGQLATIGIVGTPGGQSGSGNATVNVPTGAVVTGVTVVATANGCTASLPWISGSAIAVPNGFALVDECTRGPIIGPQTISVVGSASFIVTWTTPT